MSKVTVIRGESSNSSSDHNSWLGKSSSGASSDGVDLGKSERVVSVIAGAGLTSMAMRSHGILRAGVMLAAAAGMFQRGFTGKCYFGEIVSNFERMVNGKNSRNSSAKRRKKMDVVGEASEESFPASDSPSF